jgi:hypothetical protein
MLEKRNSGTVRRPIKIRPGAASIACPFIGDLGQRRLAVQVKSKSILSQSISRTPRNRCVRSDRAGSHKASGDRATPAASAGARALVDAFDRPSDWAPRRAAQRGTRPRRAAGQVAQLAARPSRQAWSGPPSTAQPASSDACGRPS